MPASADILLMFDVNYTFNSLYFKNEKVQTIVFANSDGDHRTDKIQR